MKKFALLLAVCALALGVYSYLAETRATVERQPVTPARAVAGGVWAIRSATPFVLERAWTHTWRREKPTFDAGWLLVLAVDPALVAPRQMEEPVLYAGDQTVERVNHGHESGNVIAILPSRRTAAGGVALDPSTLPIFFGAPFLPEQVDLEHIARELSGARARGVQPLPLPSPCELMQIQSRDELDRLAGELVLAHSPAELDLGLGLLAPPVK
ncbi:MAG: hypothetical protein JNL28_01480 [Planctomycetes bacterium]|nr:hypothetical protein [Planctomycetota bacterium]